MSFGILRIQKFSSGSVLGIQIHDKRAKNVSHTNKDIDFSKSEQNYDLYNGDFKSYHAAVKNRIGQLNLKKAVRKDAKVMCQAMVTSDKAFFERINKEQQEQFFSDAYNFICERYRKENIISAIVHLDERTPHMHVNFVPVTDDGRLSAKDVIGGRKDLNELQTAFYEQVAQKYGLERGKEVTQEQRETGTVRRHLSVADFKEATEREINTLEAKLKELAEKEKKMIDRLETTEPKFESKMASFERITYVLQNMSEETHGFINKTKSTVIKSMSNKEFLPVLQAAKDRADIQIREREAIEKANELEIRVKELERLLGKTKKESEITMQEKMEFAKLKSQLQNVPKIDLEKFLIQYDEDVKNAIYLQKLQKDDER